MADAPRPNTGTLFKNTRRGENPRAPNATGSGLVELENGTVVELELAAWTRLTRSGEKFMSLVIKPKAIRNGGGRDEDDNSFDSPNGEF
jgi:hypothetical protein